MASGITDAIELRPSILTSLEPFDSINPVLEDTEISIPTCHRYVEWPKEKLSRGYFGRC